MPAKSRNGFAANCSSWWRGTAFCQDPGAIIVGGQPLSKGAAASIGLAAGCIAK
ncbi:hypothetical protein ABID19_005473 [Mesorhizobium robiniae]|uniref:Uncharacterized protein n=1 Tax=Mesorhizobium robiniae TaxID=559315 RepID=A0ABV2GW88_9HYPH